MIGHCGIDCARVIGTWIHAVSVGEVMIALKLAEKLRELEPTLRVVLTTTTTTGFAIATKDSREWIDVLYNPLDFWPVMRRAFDVIRPQRIVLVEAEVWPNLAAEAHQRSLPLALVNARLSSRSERRFRKFRFAVAPTFRLLDLVCVQEPEDVARWQAIGVERQCIEVVGSIKFDPSLAPPDPEIPREVLARWGIDPARPIFFTGSTHSGEERIIAEIFLSLRTEFPDLFLIIAPRHFERTPEVQRMLESLDLQRGAPHRRCNHAVAGDNAGLLHSQRHGRTATLVLGWHRGLRGQNADRTRWPKSG